MIHIIFIFKCNNNNNFFLLVYGNSESTYEIILNSVEDIDNVVKTEHNKGEIEDGPIAERRCNACGHNQMSYAAVQLRSADEGQTVFYTCLKCK
jgi:DNA-directed RNA polymerase I subunit RPA12